MSNLHLLYHNNFRIIGYRQLSSDREYRKLFNEQRYRKLSNDQGYRQLSSDRCSEGVVSGGDEYEYKNHSALYAYDNLSINNDVANETSGLPSSDGKSQYWRGGGNPTFALDTPPDTSSSSLSYQSAQQQTMNSLSMPYLRRAGDYSYYFSEQDNSQHDCSVDSLKRPTTLEVCIHNI